MKMAYQNCFSGIKEETSEYNTEEQTNQLDLTPINHTIFHQSYSASQSPASITKTKRRNFSNESLNARSKRLAKNAQRMREKRSNESFDDYKIRLAKNAEANRKKRQNENEIERAMRQVKDAARQRLRRAMETQDQRSIRLAKLAERMRLVRANESLEQRSDRLIKSAARARERLMSETNEERRERLRKRAEYARRMRALNSSAASDTSSTKSHNNKRKSSSTKTIGNSTKNSNYTNSHLTSHNHNAQVSSANNNNQEETKFTPIGKYNPQHAPQLTSFQPSISNGHHEVAHNPYIPGRPDINEKHEYPQQQQVADMRTQFSAFHQNSFFRPNNFLNIPNYTNPMRLPPPDNLLYNNFGAPVQSQVQNHLPHFMPSLTLPPHPYQAAATSMLSHHIPLPSNTDHLQHQPSTQQYHPLHPFHQSNHQPLINDAEAHTSFNRPMGINGHDENKSGHRLTESHKLSRNRFRKTTSTDDDCSQSTSPELKVDVDRHKKMNELLEEQINIMLASPKRTRGRPSKGRETPNEREERLRKMAESRRIKRQNETPAERHIRLQMLTKRARERRELIRNSETEDERKERLAKQAEYARKRRMKEQTPAAKEKAEQRARELYAKLHGNGNHGEPQSPMHNMDHDEDMDNDEERVKIRIPHPYKQLTGLMIKSMHSEAYGDDNNDVLKMLEPIIEMKTV